MTVDDLARWLGTSRSALYQMRYRGTGPRGHKIGRRILFAQEDVAQWLASKREAARDE